MGHEREAERVSRRIAGPRATKSRQSDRRRRPESVDGIALGIQVNRPASENPRERSLPAHTRADGAELRTMSKPPPLDAS